MAMRRIPHGRLQSENATFLLIGMRNFQFNSAVDGKETILAQIIDLQNSDINDLLVVNQFSVAGTKQARSPDVVVFVNGWPLAVVD